MHQPLNFVRRVSHVHDNPMNEQLGTITRLQLLDYSPRVLQAIKSRQNRSAFFHITSL